MMASATWPQLREELALYPGSPDRDGAPAWSLHDPVRNLYFRIDWTTFEILSRWQLGDPTSIAAAMNRETTLQTDAETVDDVARFLLRSELVQRHGASEAAGLASEQTRRKTGWLAWLLHHYLFFRVPLWRPDRWLGRWVSLVAPLYSRGFAAMTLVALALGLAQAARQWDRFVASLVDLFSLEGLAAYGATLVCIKLVHELGHAFTAKRLGCKVPTMGVAFLVMLPMAYTDVNDAWKLASRRQRLAVGAAGIATELAIAAWATLAWSLLPDGGLKQAVFLLATTTWVSTVLINASPFMRFDGYFLLMDALDMPNLHQRAGALARWHLRRLLFSLQDLVPEQLPATRHRFLIGFAYITWAYRAVVFLGIAVLVYHVFPKPLGPLLAAIEIGWFLVAPVISEFSVWASRWRDILPQLRTWLTLLAMGGMVWLAVLPWDQRVRAQGLLSPAHQVMVAAPGSALVAKLGPHDGETVAAGTLLLQLETPDMQYQKRMAGTRAANLAWQSDAAGVENRLRERQSVIDAERAKVGAEIAGLGREMDRYALRAPIAGVLRLEDPDLQVGQWLAKSTLVGHVEDTSAWQVVTYLPERELQRVRVGDQALFVAESGAVDAVNLQVTRIDSDATRVLADGILASARGGSIMVREQRNQLIPEAAIYRVTLAPVADSAAGLRERLLALGAPTLRGSVVIRGEARAWAEDYWLAAVGLFRREAGL